MKILRDPFFMCLLFALTGHAALVTGAFLLCGAAWALIVFSAAPFFAAAILARGLVNGP